MDGQNSDRQLRELAAEMTRLLMRYVQYDINHDAASADPVLVGSNLHRSAVLACLKAKEILHDAL